MTLRELALRAAAAVGLTRRSAREQDLDQELQFHREMLEAKHRAAGLDAGAARRAARLDLGGPPQIAEAWRDQRGLPILETLWRTSVTAPACCGGRPGSPPRRCSR